MGCHSEGSSQAGGMGQQESLDIQQGQTQILHLGEMKPLHWTGWRLTGREQLSWKGSGEKSAPEESASCSESSEGEQGPGLRYQAHSQSIKWSDHSRCSALVRLHLEPSFSVCLPVPPIAHLRKMLIKLCVSDGGPPRWVAQEHSPCRASGSCLTRRTKGMKGRLSSHPPVLTKRFLARQSRALYRDLQQESEMMVTEWHMEGSHWIYRKKWLWEQLSITIGWEGRLWNLFLEDVKTWLVKAPSDLIYIECSLCFEWEVGLDTLPRSLPTFVILWLATLSLKTS